LSELLAVPPSDFSCLVGSNVGEVLWGKYLCWEASTTPETVVGFIEQSLERFSAVAKLESLPQAWEIPGTDMPGAVYRRAVVWGLLREWPMVDKCLDDARSSYCRYEDEVCEQFTEFERRLRRWVDGLRTAVDSEALLRPPDEGYSSSTSSEPGSSTVVPRESKPTMGRFVRRLLSGFKAQ
jgi:hypothetical protein